MIGYSLVLNQAWNPLSRSFGLSLREHENFWHSSCYDEKAGELKAVESRAEVYLMALQSLPKAEKGGRHCSFARRHKAKEDIVDLALIQQREGETWEGFKDYLAKKGSSAKSVSVSQHWWKELQTIRPQKFGFPPARRAILLFPNLDRDEIAWT